MLELIATEAVKSRASSGAVTATIDSLWCGPNGRGAQRTRGSEPRCLAVGQQPVGAQSTGGEDDATGDRLAAGEASAPLRTVTAYPSEPSAVPSGRTSVTVRSASTLTPRRSANHR